MGFLSALIVGPCVTPFLATGLSYVIAGGSAIKGGISLFAVGLGMGIPILIICGWGVNALPKAGPWMNTIKNIFGFLMVAAVSMRLAAGPLGRASVSTAALASYLLIGNISYGMWQNWWLAIAWLSAGFLAVMMNREDGADEP